MYIDTNDLKIEHLPVFSTENDFDVAFFEDIFILVYDLT